MYRLCHQPLKREIPLRLRPVLAAQLRRVQAVAAVSVTDKGVGIYYRSGLRLQAVSGVIRQFEKSFGTKPVGKQEPDAAAYRREAILSVGGFVIMNMLHKLDPASYDKLLLLRRLFTLLIARRYINNGVAGLWQEGRANADTLTATAVAASVLAGRPESSLTLLALSNGAEMLTEYAAERARKQISGLLHLDQREVWLIEDGRERQVPVESLQAGDRIAVHLGEKICVDGRVISGDAAVNQASITGESNPAIKQRGSFVYAGSVIEAGDLVVHVEKVGKDTSLAQVVHLVEEAQTRRAPVQNFADRMANMLVPVSFIGAAIVYGATRDWQRVLNLLFIDFSCGLKLSTATAISAAIGVAARQGILIKGGNYIENLADIDTVVLDKTGTITVGVPQIAHINLAEGVAEEEMIRLAASAELHSVHPLAVAIQRYVKERQWDVPPHVATETVVARGMRAVIADVADFSGGTVLVGSRRFMEEERVSGLPEIRHKNWGKNRLYVARNGSYIGSMIIQDPIRPAMKKTLNQMRRLGVDEIIMLTGDSKEAAAEVALQMDIDSYHAEILPEDKADYVMKLQKRGNVMMVGDGINDAPALAFADIGVSLGGSKTDIAAESSAITIRSEDPGKLYEALRIGRRTMQIINQNFTATIAVNSAAMMLGALGKISPLWAAVIHNTATLAVVLNSVRILNYSRRRNR